MPIIHCCLAAALLFGFAGCTDPPAHAQKQSLSREDIAVGMALEAFQTIYPDARVAANGQWKTPGEIQGLRGQWTYSFTQRKLSWYLFTSNDSAGERSSFTEYLNATKKIFSAYTNKYGAPKSTAPGITTFIDPSFGYGGYPVLSGTWTAGTENLRVDYSVLDGGANRSELLFTLEIKRGD